MREPCHGTLRHRGQAPSSYGTDLRAPKGRRRRPTRTPPPPSRCLYPGLAQGAPWPGEVSCVTAVVKPAEHCNLPRETRQVRHRRPVRLYVPCTQSPSYMPSRTASRSRHLALFHHETPPTRAFSFSFFWRCFLNFLSSHVVLLHHDTPPPRPSSASASASAYSTSSCL
jgi:hypothetical protein